MLGVGETRLPPLQAASEDALRSATVTASTFFTKRGFDAPWRLPPGAPTRVAPGSQANCNRHDELARLSGRRLATLSRGALGGAARGALCLWVNPSGLARRTRQRGTLAATADRRAI